MPFFSLIFAIDTETNGFGLNRSLPWDIAFDRSVFKETTIFPYRKNKKNILISGYHTYHSKPPLNDEHRIEIMVDRNDSLDAILADLDEKQNDYGKIFIIGGKKLIEYCLTHPQCEEILLTYITFDEKEDIEYDTYINLENLSHFHQTGKIHRKDKCKKNGNVTLDFLTYHRFMTEEAKYLKLLEQVKLHGEKRLDRTGVGTLSLFGPQIEFDLTKGFPLLTTKKLVFSSILKELLWFISGSTNISYLKENGIKIWDGNTSREFLDGRGFYDYETGDTGPIYGYQWRHFGGNFKDKNDVGIDQLERLLTILKTDPTSRRMYMSAWNPVDLDKMCLEPCHVSFQLYVRENKYLDGKLNMRSNDLFLGAPWNIACYSLLIYMFCHLTKNNYTPGKLFYTIGDAHVYQNHLEQVNLQLNRPKRPLPQLKIYDPHYEIKEWDDFKEECFILSDYEPHPIIKADMAV